MGNEKTPQHSVYEPVAVAIKNFQIVGVNMFIDEFPKHKRTRMRTAYSDEDLSGSPDEYSFYGYRQSPDENIPNLLKRVKFLSSCGKQNIKLKLKQNDAIPGHKVCPSKRIFLNAYFN